MEAILKKQIILSKPLGRIILLTIFVIMISLGAFVRIPLPFSPVPITLQTMFVLLSAALLGNRLGVITQLSYILLGVLGLPIFAGAGSGLLYLLGPTAGYLYGFILSSLFLGSLIKYSKNNWLSIFSLFCLADFIILISGVFWLRFIFRYSLPRLLLIGMIPFIPGDLFKAALATTLYLKLRPRLKKIF